jgi:4-amino-4-deoxy-L-arabinose transferase-like glycosyltransferase
MNRSNRLARLLLGRVKLAPHECNKSLQEGFRWGEAATAVTPLCLCQGNLFQCLPWSLFFPALVALMVDRRSSLPEPLVFAAVRFTAVLGFFTLSSGRCVVYVLPCVPALALMLGYLVSEMTGKKAGLSATSVALFNGATVTMAIAALGLVIVAIFGRPANFLALFIRPTERC